MYLITILNDKLQVKSLSKQRQKILVTIRESKKALWHVSKFPEICFRVNTAVNKTLWSLQEINLVNLPKLNNKRPLNKYES